MNQNQEVKIGTKSIVVRICDVCNNRCAHCCFSCGPENKQRMSIDVAQRINDYFQDTKSEIYWFNMMGGEPTIHPQYEKIVDCFGKRHIRFVTNGWWINRDKPRDRFVEFLKSHDNLYIGVSRDRYHPKGVGDKAYNFLMNLGFKDDFGLSTPNPDDEDGSIVAVGRAFHNFINYQRSLFSCYCHTSNTRNTSFTVLEDGTITHCPFGIFPIGHINKISFNDLEEKKKKYVKSWDDMMSCTECYKYWLFRARYKAIENGYKIYEETPL
jgi:MoaA/NifB/PqqE/SkfB family radical SAM enzyme